MFAFMETFGSVILPSLFSVGYHFAMTKVRQALESLKLAKEAKEEADDALDDVETAGTGDSEVPQMEDQP